MTADTENRFSQTIRAASWALHGSAEGAHFMRDLLEGHIERERYAVYVAQLHHVYTVLEQAATKMREQPIAVPFVREELTRVPALEADLRYFFGDDWSSQVGPNAATESYADRLREVCFTWPGGFVAHHYTRYLGDLSGGQMIGKVVARTYDLTDGPGTEFYRFDRITDLDGFKNQYRTNLDQAPWEPEEKQKIVDEVLLAYKLNTVLLAALD